MFWRHNKCYVRMCEFETSERFHLRCNRFFSKILEFFENLEKVAKDKVVFY